MPYLSMTGITKQYGWDLVANNAVDFSVERPEIHALVGENGAGKTTLMRILYGLELADTGSIAIAGRPVTVNSPRDARRLGIGMVQQHFSLIPGFTVAENVVLGGEPVRAGMFVDHGEADKRVRDLVANHGFSLEPRARVRTLSVGEMQQVEIVKALYHEARLLILDEPTSVLAEPEIQALFDTLRSLRRSGMTLIIITHKLREVLAISDRITVMRGGSIVAVRRTADVDPAELSRLMIGHSPPLLRRGPATSSGTRVLELQEVSLRSPGVARPSLAGVNLVVRAEEIVGVAGMNGSGVSELEDIAAGLRPVSSGVVLHGGQDIAGLTPGALRKLGLAYVPSDRLRRGSSLQAPLSENMIVASHHRFLRAGILRGSRVRRFTDRLLRRYAIDKSPRTAMGSLSGGNIQKVILARELIPGSRLVIAAEPTCGLDVASSRLVHEKLLGMRAAGAGVLLLSSNLDELMAIADSVAVLYRGRVVRRVATTDPLARERIGDSMMGLPDRSMPAVPEVTIDGESAA